MAALQMLNPKAEFAARDQALAVNINAAQGLQNVLKSNLGPRGTLKMYIVETDEIFCDSNGRAHLTMLAGLSQVAGT